MTFNFLNLPLGLALLTILLVCECAPVYAAQLPPAATSIQVQEAVIEPDDVFGDGEKDEPKEEPEEKKDDVTDTASLQVKSDVADNYIRFHMWDGSIVAGEVQVDDISIKTEFGTLQIPIQRVKKLYPGLDSFPQLNDQITSLVEGLGDKDFDVREKSHRALSAMGMQIRNEIDKFEDGGSAERKKRLASIKTEIDQALDEFEEEGDSSAERSLIRGDAVETPEFSVVGKIQQETFTVNSKFGKLTVTLSDIKMAERSFNERPEEIRKNVTVGAEAFFQRKPVSTRIRVNKGDKISIRADGTVNWTNWSSTSTPTGMSNQGQYQGINSGTLCARIGTSGKIVKIGSKGEMVAKRSGILYLAVAMQDSYLANNGYKWTGEYKAKVHVKPVESE